MDLKVNMDKIKPNKNAENLKAKMIKILKGLKFRRKLFLLNFTARGLLSCFEAQRFDEP